MNRVFKKQILPNSEQTYRADPFWRVVVTSEPKPWPSQPEVLGICSLNSARKPLWRWGYRTGPLWPVCNPQVWPSGVSGCSGKCGVPAGPGCPSRDQVVDVSGQLLGGVQGPSPSPGYLRLGSRQLCSINFDDFLSSTLGHRSKEYLKSLFAILIESHQCSLSDILLLHSGDAVGPPPRCTGWLTHSFSQYLLAIYPMPGIILGTGNRPVNKSDRPGKVPIWRQHISQDLK